MKCACEPDVDQICSYCKYILDLERQIRGLSITRMPDDLDSAATRYQRDWLTVSGNRIERDETQKELETRLFIAERNRYYHLAVGLLHDLYYVPWDERK